MPRLTRIYTKTGDEGMTGLGGGRRVAKDSPRVRAYGTVDELNSAIGVALALGLSDRLVGRSSAPSRTSCSISAPTCAGPRTTSGASGSRPSSPSTSKRLEAPDRRAQRGRRAVDELHPPGGAPGAAALHVARTVCRRAERETITLSHEEPIGELVLPYLNRLSDALFVMARYENHERGVVEPLWQPGL